MSRTGRQGNGRGVKRPFRLWNHNEGRNERWRCYSDPVRAQDRVLSILRWAKIGTAIEVYDSTTAKSFGVYKRYVAAVHFTPPGGKFHAEG